MMGECHEGGESHDFVSSRVPGPHEISMTQFGQMATQVALVSLNCESG